MLLEKEYRVMFNKNGGNASKNSKKGVLNLDKNWIEKMGITEDNKSIIMAFDKSHKAIYIFNFKSNDQCIELIKRFEENNIGEAEILEKLKANQFSNIRLGNIVYTSNSSEKRYGKKTRVIMVKDWLNIMEVDEEHRKMTVRYNIEDDSLKIIKSIIQ